MPYFLSYVASYDETHQLSNFAGNLLSLKENYLSGSPDQKETLARQFDATVDSLVMKNGVRKTTYRMRLHDILAKVLADEQCRLPQSAIEVLDVPASTGVAALDSIAMLSKYYSIRAYVLGDLFFRIYYDIARDCIFDEEFNLLQVKLKNRFFSIYRAHRSGEVYSHLTEVLLLPVDWVSRYLRQKYVYSEKSTIVPILVIHPEVEARLRTGDLSVKKMDVFKHIAGNYDLILSFNLLQRNYFPPDQIACGIENLKRALNEQGFLIMGDEVSFSVLQKREGSLVVVKKEGQF